MSQYRYKTAGTCSQEIIFNIEDGIVSNIQFLRGCNGNTQGIAALAEGLSGELLIKKLSGIRCESKLTSCPDQLAKAIQAALDGKI